MLNLAPEKDPFSLTQESNSASTQKAMRWSRHLAAVDRIAAVDRDCGAGHEIGSGRGKEHGDTGKVVWSTPATGRCAIHDAIMKPVDIFSCFFGKVGVDPAGQNRIRLNVVLSPKRSRARESFATMPPLVEA